MSNTDGEETNIDMLTRRVINHLNDYAIKGVLVREDVNNMVIESRLAQKELASLREQLATEQDMRSTAEFANRMIIKDLNEKLKQKEETILSHKVIIDKYANEESETITSLREQLKENELELKHWMDQHVQIKWTVSDLNDKLKQKEDENRELLDSISQLIYAMNTTGLPWNTDSTAEKAYANCRSLLKKHIG